MSRSLWLLIVVVTSLVGTPLRAADEPAIDSGRQALGSSWRYPWYDDSSDGLRPLSIRDDTPSTPNSSGSGGGFGEILKVLVWIALAIMLAAVLYFLIWTFLGRESRSASKTSTAQSVGNDAARIEALPFRVERGSNDLLGEARRLYEAGRYAEAIVYLFSYQLVALDRSHVVHLHRGKTNRQYLREIGRRGSLRSLVEQTMVAFEDVFFGRHGLDRQRFEISWNRLDEFEADLKAESEERKTAGSVT